MTLNILGVRVEISVPFTVLLVFLLINDKTGLMSASLFAVFFHELGHLAVMVMYHCQPKTVKLSSSGILICGSAFCTAKENLIIAMSGPIVNLVLSVVFILLSKLFCCTLLLYFAVVQFLVGFVNLLPVKGLDGGTALNIILSKFSRINAEFICNIVSIVLSCLLLTVGVAVSVKNAGNPSLMLLGIYLLVLNLIKR